MTSRSRSRSPISSNLTESSRKYMLSNINTSVLHLYNLPTYWNYEHVKAFIKEKNRTISFGIKFIKILAENSRRKGECLVKFANCGICMKGFELLNGTHGPNGKIIRAEPTMELLEDSPSQEIVNQKQQISSLALNNALNKIKLQVENAMQSPSSLQTYGLSTTFLDSLGIKPPLLDTIFIANLDWTINEHKIREIFGHAGQIISMQLAKRTDKKPTLWAKVEYDHPVEAVQAISMLHDRELYGKKLTVQMDTNPRLYQRPIPEGLSGFGPGLGENGTILKGVRTTIELQVMKNQPVEQTQVKSDQNQTANQETMNQQLQVDPMAMMNMQSIPPLNTILPIHQNPGMLGLQNLMNPPMQHGLFQTALPQGGTDLMTALAALQTQSMAANMPLIAQNVPNTVQSQSEWTQGQISYNNLKQQDDNSNPHYGYSRPTSSHEGRNSRYEADNQSENKKRRSEERDTCTLGSDMLVFNNLPPSVSLAALNNKMREVGDVKFAEMTGQGRAIVRFFNSRDAERCVNLFDRSKVDGQAIDVRFF